MVDVAAFTKNQAIPESPEIYAGYLTKQGGKYKTWRRRWFSVRGNQMLYFKEQGVRETPPSPSLPLCSWTSLFPVLLAHASRPRRPADHLRLSLGPARWFSCCISDRWGCARVALCGWGCGGGGGWAGVEFGQDLDNPPDPPSLPRPPQQHVHTCTSTHARAHMHARTHLHSSSAHSQVAPTGQGLFNFGLSIHGHFTCIQDPKPIGVITLAYPLDKDSVLTRDVSPGLFPCMHGARQGPPPQVLLRTLLHQTRICALATCCPCPPTSLCFPLPRLGYSPLQVSPLPAASVDGKQNRPYCFIIKGKQASQRT